MHLFFFHLSVAFFYVHMNSFLFREKLTGIISVYFLFLWPYPNQKVNIEKEKERHTNTKNIKLKANYQLICGFGVASVPFLKTMSFVLTISLTLYIPWQYPRHIQSENSDGGCVLVSRSLPAWQSACVSLSLSVGLRLFGPACYRHDW